MSFLLFLAVVVLGLGFGFWRLDGWSKQRVTLSSPVVLEFPRGTRLAHLADELETDGLVDSSLLFQLWVKLRHDYTKFQAGTYRFEGSTSPQEVVAAISAGDNYVPVAVQFTIPEGFNSRQIFARLVAHGVGTQEAFDRLGRDRNFLRSMNIAAPTIEGYLYPATYSFTKLPSPEECLRKMVATFFERLPKNYADDLKELGLSLEKAVIFASLIQAETRFDDERPLISEVIWRRLRAGEPLAIDAALIYGIKDYHGDITWKHLKDRGNPYNLRLHKGLPPTPVDSPSVDSLVAVLNPSKNGYYYYVLKPDGEGRHHFSRTLSEHNRHVRLLLEASKHKPSD